METENKDIKNKDDMSRKKEELPSKAQTQIENNPLKNVKTAPIVSVLRYNYDKEQKKQEEKNNTSPSQ